MHGTTAQNALASLTSQNVLEKAEWTLRYQIDDRQGQTRSSEISLTDVKLQRNRTANRAAPISKLPNEILAAIFEAGYSAPFPGPEPNDISNIPFEILVSHVTYAWRETAISLARMWTKIHIRVGNPFEQLEGRSTIYLSRSKTMPFDVYIDLGAITSPPSTNISFVCQAVTSHVARCQNLLIRSNWRHSLYQLAEQLLHHLPAAPLLRNLYIRLEPNHLDTTNVAASGDILAVLQSGAPRLTSVRVAGIPLNYCLPPMSAVTSLRIYEPIYGSFESCSTTRNILNDLPVLTELVLHGWILDDYGLDSVRLPALRSLKITTADDFGNLLVPLKVISAPLLEDLYIADTSDFDSFEDWDLPWDYTTIESRFPLLHSLVLDGCLIPPAIYDAFGCAFPTITELTVLGMDLNDVLRQSAWPNLHILSFDKFPVNMYAANSLARALAMRLAIGKPVHTLRSTKPLQLLKGLVAVEELWTPPATDMADWDGDGIRLE